MLQIYAYSGPPSFYPRAWVYYMLGRLIIYSAGGNSQLYFVAY